MKYKALITRPRIWVISLGLLGMALLSACSTAEPTPVADRGLGRGQSSTAIPSETPLPSETPTDTPTETLTPSVTPTETPDWTPTPGPSPTPSNTPTITPSPTRTPRPTRTPTATPSPTPDRQRVPVLSNATVVIRENAATPAVPVPTVQPTIPVPPKTSNILLLGNDVDLLGTGVERTDSMMIVSINRDRNTASIVSLPRDLYVYMPGWTMNKLNTAVPVGGVGMLKEAILYNFGIPIHYYARVDYGGFVDIVDAIGGVEVAVSCALEDWRLKEPGLDIFEEDNYERFRLEPGIHRLDGDTALWYARSRKTTSDFDRGRRQQQIVRALLDEAVDAGLILEVPQLWGIYNEIVETDLDIGRILQFAASAPDIQSNGIQSIYLVGDNLVPFTLDTPDGPVSAQLPNETVINESFQRLYQPPALNSASRPPLTVEIFNGTGDEEMALLAAENLRWHGFAPIISNDDPDRVELTTLEFNAPNLRGSFDWLITWIFDLRRPGDRGNGAYQGDGVYGIDLNPESESEYNYTLMLGEDYNPCRPELFAPKPFSNDN